MTDDKAPKRKTTTPRAKKKTPATSAAKAGSPPPAVYESVTAPTDRRSLIELEAYLRAERRGFAPGHELEDWLAAERSVGRGAG